MSTTFKRTPSVSNLVLFRKPIVYAKPMFRLLWGCHCRLSVADGYQTRKRSVDHPSTTSLYREEDEVKATTTQTVMTDRRASVYTQTIVLINDLTTWLSMRSTTAVINRAASVANNQLST